MEILYNRGIFELKLLWVQIKNFRLIKDLGRIYFNLNLIIFVGKNELGKFNILKVLDCFLKDKFDKDNDFLIDYIEEYFEVVVYYELEEEIIDYICDNFNLDKDSLFISKGVILIRMVIYKEVIEVEFYRDIIENVVVVIGIVISVINKEFKLKFKFNIEVIILNNFEEVIEEIKFCFINIKSNLNNE